MKESLSDKFVESLHKSEFERKDKHESIDSFMLAVISVLGSIGLYLLKIAPSSPDDWYDWAFWVLGIPYGLLVAYSAVNVGCSIWPRTIAYVSHPSEVSNYIVALENHFVQWNSTGDLDELVDAQMKKYVRGQYLQCAANNRDVMQTKLVWQVRSRKAACMAIFLMVLNAGPIFLVQKDRVEEQSVKIVSWPDTYPQKGN